MCAKLIRLGLPVFLALCFAPPLSGQVKETTDDAQTIEEDYRLTSSDQRQRAVGELRKSADELRNSGQRLAAARTLNRVGRLQIRMYLAEEAITTFRQALQLLKQQPDLRTKVDSLNGLASSYKNLSDCDLAEPLANRAIDLSTQSNYIAGRAEALLPLSYCQNYRDHPLAIQSAQESLGLWRSINRPRGIADAHVAMGEYQMGQNDLVESEENLQTALNLYRELNAVDDQATVFIYLGFLEHRNGAWQKALGFYTHAQSLIEEKGDPFRMAQITGGFGDAFLESGLPEIALAKFRECLNYFRLSKGWRGVRAMMWSIGRAQFMSGKYPDALESLQQARTASRKDRVLIAMCDEFLGRTYYALNDYAAALSHFQSALDGYGRAGNKMERSRTQALMGQVYEKQGRFDKARHNYQTALKTFRTLADRINESATLYAMGSLELRENNLDTADDHLRQSIEVTEDMKRVSTSSDLTAAFSATVHERYQSYIECLMRKEQAQPAQGFAVRAFQTSELARGRSLAELLRATQTNLAPGLDLESAQREKSLRQALRVKEDYKVTLLGGKYKLEEVAVLDAELARLEAEYKQINETIRARYPAYDQLNRAIGWDLTQIQERVVVDDRTVLLEYSLGTDHSYVWIVTRHAITSRELPPEATITNVAQEVYELIKTTPSAETDRRLNLAVRQLSEMVVSPVAAALQQRRVIVVADGALNYIPFQILRARADNDEPLVVGNEVINSPSASILGQLRQETARRHAPEKLLAAFGDPVFPSNYNQRKDPGRAIQDTSAPLPEDERLHHALRNIEIKGSSFDTAAIQGLFYAAHELANLRNVASDSEAFVAADFDATRERLQNTDLSKFAILHFATHGFLDPVQPENSGLVLSTVDREGKPQAGFVGLQEIYSLHTPVDLVVLSACQTALGKDVRGEGLIGLTRGFMYAGASSVVSSLWKVDDEATAELMKHFYTNMLQRGMTPAAALREAQNSIRQQPQWRDPYFWAAFTLQGDYHQPIHSTQTRGWKLYLKVILGVVLLALLAGAAWGYRRRRALRTA